MNATPRIALFIAALVTSAYAAAPHGKKPSSMMRLVEYVLAHGKQDTTIDVVEKDLGFPDSKPAKEMSLDSSTKSGGISRTISVRYSTNDESKLTPDSIFWSETVDSNQSDGKRHTDMWCFRSDLNGTLLGVVRGGGIEDDLDEKPAPIDPTARKKFQEVKAELLKAPLKSLSTK